jgi:hypothetical protein
MCPDDGCTVILRSMSEEGGEEGAEHWSLLLVPLFYLLVVWTV